MRINKINILMLAFSLFSIIGGSQSTNYDSNNIAAVFVSNINGSIVVNKYRGTDIIVELSNSKLQDGYMIHQLMYEDTLVIVMEDKHFDTKKFDSDYEFPGNIRQRNCRQSCNPELVNITINIPNDILIKAATINDGDILIKDISSPITAKNINGNIEIELATQVDVAHTINGDLDISFVKQPKSNGKYYTLNGDLNLKVPDRLNAEINFKSFNGDFYTDIDNLKLKESKIEKINKSGKFHIKADQKTYMTAGNGGVVLSLETFNGDAILKTLEK